MADGLSGNPRYWSGIYIGLVIQVVCYYFCAQVGDRAFLARDGSKEGGLERCSAQACSVQTCSTRQESSAFPENMAA